MQTVTFFVDEIESVAVVSRVNTLHVVLYGAFGETTAVTDHGRCVWEYERDTAKAKRSAATDR
jgi:hypothetical protein